MLGWWWHARAPVATDSNTPNNTLVSILNTKGAICYLRVMQVVQTAMCGHKGYESMSDKSRSASDPNQPAIYQIRIKGHLSRQWTEWFGGMNITLEESGDTSLTGTVVDQAALHGLLKKVRDLGMPLISVNRVRPDLADAAHVKE